jgi:hypothetical protein
MQTSGNGVSVPEPFAIICRVIFTLRVMAGEAPALNANRPFCLEEEEMKIELLYVAECPNHLPAVEIIQDVLREQGLSEEIQQIEVTDGEQAVALCFRGSPSVRVDGKDVEPNITGSSGSFGISCRTYLVDGRRQGTPRREWIRNAVRSSSPER